MIASSTNTVHIKTQPGNKKLGKLKNWSTPNGGYTDGNGQYFCTCPGASSVCLNGCYVIQIIKRYNHVLDSQIQTHKLIQYAIKHGADLRLSPTPKSGSTTRGHVSGDLESSEYVNKLIEMVSHYSDCWFYFYTRSWRVDGMAEALTRLFHQPNVNLIFSTDKDMADPREYTAPNGSRPWESLKGMKTAYFIADLDDIDYMTGEELIAFRNNRRSDQRQIYFPSGKKVTVCPKENGNRHNQKVTCQTCRICLYK